MTERDLGTYQMLWDCPFCGVTGLLGLDHRHCPACGAAQDEATRYFPAEADRVAVVDHRYHGADVDCPSCSTPNAALSKHCVNCGMGLGEAAAVARVDASPPKDGPAPKEKKGGFGFGTLLLGAVALMVAYILINTCTSKDVVVTVSARAWERSVQIERLGESPRGGWCDALPEGVSNPTRSRKVRGQEQVPDGETCVQKQRDNGDGTATAYEDCTPRLRSVDVEDDWCSWTGRAWGISRNETAAGVDAPSWPAVTLAKEGDCLGCERELARTESYSVTLTGDDVSTCTFSEARWNAFTVGSRWTGEGAGLNGAVRCATLTAAP